ncbi:MAG TPA: alpha/beta fold hydrolase [Terracidiphilus sp.]|nr:alpha/beta fold hydrolase [Terracidiphilus sp.]
MPQKKPPQNPTRAAHSSGQPPTVSPWWLLGTLGAVVVGAVVLAWVAFCFVFWQGSWQLLYHPSSQLTRTPAEAGIPFSPVAFATTESGVPRLSGWWIPAAPNSPFANYVALYFHGANGNLSDTVGALQRLHNAGLTVFAIDYRGYGQSQFVHPSEAHWRQDADWAIQYLTSTRHVPPGSILLVGQGLGADLALEVAAAHPDLAGVVLQQIREDAADVVFHDPRARALPAHLLVKDRWNLDPPAAALRIPSLWFDWFVTPGKIGRPDRPEPFQKVIAPHALVWLVPSHTQDQDFDRLFQQWLRDFPDRTPDFPLCQLSSGLPCSMDTSNSN